MEVISLPNGESFKTENVEAAEVIRDIVNGRVLKAKVDALDEKGIYVLIDFLRLHYLRFVLVL